MNGIIVEGPDGSGKSTLIRKLRYRYQYPTVHLVKFTEREVPQVIRILLSGPILFDRCHLSPMVYGSVLRDGPELSAKQFVDIENMLLELGFIQIVCLTNVDRMLLNNQNEEQLWNDVRKESVVQTLKEGYLAITAVTKLPTFIYDYQKTTLETLMEWIDAS